MRSFRVEGIVIKRKDFGEGDRILTVFTKQRGKIQVIAKGVRKVSSRRSPHVELLNESIIGVYDGKLPILTEADCLNHFSLLKEDLEKAGWAFYICELVDGLLAENQENREVYNLIQRTLFELEIIQDPRPIIKRFEQEILILLGFWPKNRLFLEESEAYIEDIMEKKIKTKRIFSKIF